MQSIWQSGPANKRNFDFAPKHQKYPKIKCQACHEWKKNNRPKNGILLELAIKECRQNLKKINSSTHVKTHALNSQIEYPNINVCRWILNKSQCNEQWASQPRNTGSNMRKFNLLCQVRSIFFSPTAMLLSSIFRDWTFLLRSKINKQWHFFFLHAHHVHTHHSQGILKFGFYFAFSTEFMVFYLLSLCIQCTNQSNIGSLNPCLTFSQIFFFFLLQFKWLSVRWYHYMNWNSYKILYNLLKYLLLTCSLLFLHLIYFCMEVDFLATLMEFNENRKFHTHLYAN